MRYLGALVLGLLRCRRPVGLADIVAMVPDPAQAAGWTAGRTIEIRSGMNCREVLRQGNDPGYHAMHRLVLACWCVWRWNLHTNRRIPAFLLLFCPTMISPRVRANALADRGTKEPLRPQMTRDVTHDLKCHLPGRPYTRFEFISRQRQDVRISELKSFTQRYDQDVRRRITGLRPTLYTRMGAALRHASDLLAEQQQRQRLLLLITDGKPNDCDGYEGRYGCEDTRHAVLAARQRGLHPFCITIDQEAWLLPTAHLRRPGLLPAPPSRRIATAPAPALCPHDRPLQVSVSSCCRPGSGAAKRRA